MSRMTEASKAMGLVARRAKQGMEAKDRNVEVTYPKNALFIQDGNALFHMTTNLPQTCGEICLQFLGNMIPKQHFVFSTDCYQIDSVKAQERVRRGSTEKYIIGGPYTCKPYDFKSFLTNELNKKQLCDLLVKVCGGNEAASRLEKCKKAVVCVDGRAYDLTSTNGEVQTSEIHALRSNQEKTDMRIVLYLHQAVKWGYKSSVVMTPDTEILMILLLDASTINLTIFLDLGTGMHCKLINVSELAESLGTEYCSTLLGYYVFSGEDYVLQQEIQFFTCVMYGHGQLKLIDAVRAKMLKKMVSVDRALYTNSNVNLERGSPQGQSEETEYLEKEEDDANEEEDEGTEVEEADFDDLFSDDDKGD
ncbi:uncharacterized protein V6R79_004691 [Siganus canaliculatus]